MNSKTISKAFFILLCVAGTCRPLEPTESSETQQQKNPKNNPIDMVLQQLNNTTSELKSYQGQVEFKFIQPALESEALRKGVLYYSRVGDKSSLRINFNTLKQEDEDEQKYIEQYIVLDGARLTHSDYQFEGLWLVHLDYEIEQIRYYQLAKPNDPNKPVDVFDLASKNLPMLGFSKIEDLKEQFEIKLIEPKKGEPKEFIQVHLTVKPNSVFKDDYVSIDFWIDKKLGLPVKIIAVATEPEPPFGDIYHIRFLNPKVNKSIDKKVFEFKIPQGFGEEIITLKEKG